MIDPENVVLADATETANTDWERQIVWLPLTQLLHYERSMQERNEWAMRNLDLQHEVERLRAERGE